MNNPLIPQLRPDKNGKLVTRHVVDKSVPSGSSKSLPAPLHPVVPQEPVKTEKELKAEACEALVDRVTLDVPPIYDTQRTTALNAASWLRTEHLQRLTEINDADRPAYAPSDSHIRSELLNGRSFNLAMAASVLDVAEKLHNAGFRDTQTPLQLSANYFGSQTVKYIKDSHISDFRLHYLASAMSLEDYDTGEGKLDHYRQLMNLNDHYDEVLKALPVLHAIMSDNDNYMVDDGIEDIVTVAVHAARHSEHEIERIAAFVKDRNDLYTYDTDLIDEMLQTESSSLGTGVL